MNDLPNAIAKLDEMIYKILLEAFLKHASAHDKRLFNAIPPGDEQLDFLENWQEEQDKQ